MHFCLHQTGHTYMKKLLCFLQKMFLASVIFLCLLPCVFSSAALDRTKSTDTLKTVNSFDYYSDSITGCSSDKMSVSAIKKSISAFNANFTGPDGMPVKEYKAAMEQIWTDCTVYNSEPEKISFSLTQTYKYDELVSIMKKLSRYPGVYLYDIGSSGSGRRMYAIEIDVPSDIKKETVVLTGTIHARETAGTTFILKELIDLVQSTSDEAKDVLSRIRFVTVPLVNPDGREGVCFDTSHFTYKNGQLWKASANGTDLGRNFPGLSWGQVSKGNKISSYISDSPSKLYYPGDYAGSCNETKALMKFLYHYVAHEKARILIDYHQQGAISYAGKPWADSKKQQAEKNLAVTLFKKMNEGNRIHYNWHTEDDVYGLNGTGSTLTDYAESIACGAKFSPGYGFYVYTDGVKEFPLCAIPRMDRNYRSVNGPVNPDFLSMTFEIGYGREYLGYSEATRKLLSKEYFNYHFDKVLYYVADIANPDRISLNTPKIRDIAFGNNAVSQPLFHTLVKPAEADTIKDCNSLFDYIISLSRSAQGV